MIEALIDHFQKRGYNVSVMPHALLIWKIIDGTRYNKAWHTAPEELKLIRDESILFQEADRIMALFEQATKIQTQVQL